MEISFICSYLSYGVFFILPSLPFFLQDWSLQFVGERHVAPRQDVNAPDLYIPGKEQGKSVGVTLLFSLSLGKCC